MPFKDIEKERLNAIERKRRFRQRRHDERFGVGAGNMAGRHGNHARGEKNGRWNDSKIISSEGYVKLRVGRDHPLADPNGYAYEHLIVWLAAGKRMPEPHELIHHKNENKQDNRIGNLEIKTRSEHAVLHNANRERNSLGQFKGEEAR